MDLLLRIDTNDADFIYQFLRNVSDDLFNDFLKYCKENGYISKSNAHECFKENDFIINIGQIVNDITEENEDILDIYSRFLDDDGYGNYRICNMKKSNSLNNGII